MGRALGLGRQRSQHPSIRCHIVGTHVGRKDSSLSQHFGWLFQASDFANLRRHAATVSAKRCQASLKVGIAGLFHSCFMRVTQFANGHNLSTPSKCWWQGFKGFKFRVVKSATLNACFHPVCLLTDVQQHLGASRVGDKHGAIA
jgi:hypothetical protein